MNDEHILRNRSFLFIWIGNIISELGAAFGTFCNSILIFQLTGSTMALGSMWILYFVPSLILQLFIGPFIDRWSRKWIMVFSQWSRGLAFLIPLMSSLMGSLEAWHIFSVQIFIGLITPLYSPANQSIIPTIIPASQLSAANAYLDGTIRLMTFLAPFAGGVVVESIGVKATLPLVCAFLITSGFILLFIQESRVELPIRKSWLEQFIEGISYFFKQPLIVWLGVFLAFVQFGVGVSMVINLPYITRELSGSYAEYGYFMSSFPLGYVLGALLVRRISHRSRRALMLGALIIGGSTYISLGMNGNIYFAFVTEGVAGVAMAIFSVHNITIFQQHVPNSMMGKISSVRLFIIRGTMLLGVMTGTILSEIWPIRLLYILIGSVICTVSILGLLLPYFKFMDYPNDGKRTA